jgi:hypothetical protein
MNRGHAKTRCDADLPAIPSAAPGDMNMNTSPAGPTSAKSRADGANVGQQTAFADVPHLIALICCKARQILKNG